MLQIFSFQPFILLYLILLVLAFQRKPASTGQSCDEECWGLEKLHRFW